MKLFSFHTLVHQLLQVALICSVIHLSNFNLRAQHETRQLERAQTTTNIADARRLALVIGNGAYTGIPSTFVLLRISIYESVNSVILLPYADFRNIEIEK